jgi:hypothetical protein
MDKSYPYGVGDAQLLLILYDRFTIEMMQVSVIPLDGK